MRARSLPLLGVVLVGCRAVLGIEDPPAETGSAATGTSTGALVGPASGATSTGSGGAPSTSPAGPGGGTSDGGGLSAVAVGNGGGGADAGGSSGVGAGEPGPVDVDLGSRGLRLAYDPDESTLYAVDLNGHFWGFDADFSSIQRCLQESNFAPEVFAPGYMAAHERGIAYTAEGKEMMFVYLDPSWDVEDDRLCGAPIGEFDISGMAIFNHTFYGLDTNTADLDTFAFGIHSALTTLSPGPLFSTGRGLAFGTELGFGTAIDDEGFGVILIYDVGEGEVVRHPEPATKYLAVAASPSDQFFAWRRLGGDALVDASGVLTDLPPYEGTPTLSADDEFVYAPTEDGLVICRPSESCKFLPGNDARVSDVLATEDWLYVLQGSHLFRYPPMTEAAFDELDPFIP